jgi:hypothetical protein
MAAAGKARRCGVALSTCSSSNCSHAAPTHPLNHLAKCRNPPPCHRNHSDGPPPSPRAPRDHQDSQSHGLTLRISPAIPRQALGKDTAGVINSDKPRAPALFPPPCRRHRLVAVPSPSPPSLGHVGQEFNVVALRLGEEEDGPRISNPWHRHTNPTWQTHCPPPLSFSWVDAVLVNQ